MPGPMGLLGDKVWKQRQSMAQPVDASPQRVVYWAQPDPHLPRIWNPKVRGQASLTSHGWPATWASLQLTPALPDLTTALARRTAPVIQPFNAGNLRQTMLQIPAIFVPVKGTGFGT